MTAEFLDIDPEAPVVDAEVQELLGEPTPMVAILSQFHSLRRASSLTRFLLPTLAVMSTVAVALHHTGGGALNFSSAGDVIGTSNSTASPFADDASTIPTQGVDEQGRGSYVTLLKAVVRLDEDMKSKIVGGLPEGSMLLIHEVRGNRARIEEPLHGWLSLTTESGLDILKPDDTVHLVKLLQSSKMNSLIEEQKKQLMKASRKIEAVKANLTKIEMGAEGMFHKMSMDQIAARLGKDPGTVRKVFSGAGASKVGEAIGDKANDVFKDIVKPEARQDLMNKLSHLKGLKALQGFDPSKMKLSDVSALPKPTQFLDNMPQQQAFASLQKTGKLPSSLDGSPEE